MNNIVFGRYVNANTFVHKLDPRTKIFLLILFSVGIFLQFTNNITNLLMSCCYLGAVFILMFITRINVLNLFKSLSMMWFMLLFLFIVETVKNSLAEGDLGAAMEACEATPGPLSNILMSGFNSITEGYDVVLDSVSSQASIETEKLMQRVNYLNLCGQLAPMFGLMGTVTGMVSAFGSLGTVKGAAQTAALAQSISSALYTTAVGLFIAVPAILAFTFIKNNASKIILMMEAMTYELINTLKNAEVKEE